jgi:hypothetical protein
VMTVSNCSPIRKDVEKSRSPPGMDSISPELVRNRSIRKRKKVRIDIR